MKESMSNLDAANVLDNLRGLIRIEGVTGFSTCKCYEGERAEAINELYTEALSKAIAALVYPGGEDLLARNNLD